MAGQVEVVEERQEVIKALPIAKEEARRQFDYWTEKLNLKHTFTFDEMYDFLLEKRIVKVREQKALELRDKFRNTIVAFEANMKKIPGCLGKDPFPLVHTFAGGLYIRHLTVPPRTLTVTQIHKQEHAFFLQKGTISILTEEDIKKFTAPYQGITKIGTKRIIWHHDEVIFVTVHATKETEIDKAEEQLFAKNFDEIEELEAQDEAKIRDFIDVVSKEEV